LRKTVQDKTLKENKFSLKFLKFLISFFCQALVSTPPLFKQKNEGLFFAALEERKKTFNLICQKEKENFLKTHKTGEKYLQKKKVCHKFRNFSCNVGDNFCFFIKFCCFFSVARIMNLKREVCHVQLSAFVVSSEIRKSATFGGEKPPTNLWFSSCSNLLLHSVPVVNYESSRFFFRPTSDESSKKVFRVHQSQIIRLIRACLHIYSSQSEFE
jgi:hypothetical protein